MASDLNKYYKQRYNSGCGLSILTAVWEAKEDGSVDNIPLGQINGWIELILTMPLEPVPTTAYDVEILNSDGFDVLEGAAHNRSNSVIQRVRSRIGNSDMSVPIVDKLILSVSGNLIPGAKGKVVITIKG